jgi:hypothetical protein
MADRRRASRPARASRAGGLTPRQSSEYRAFQHARIWRSGSLLLLALPAVDVGLSRNERIARAIAELRSRGDFSSPECPTTKYHSAVRLRA